MTGGNLRTYSFPLIRITVSAFFIFGADSLFLTDFLSVFYLICQNNKNMFTTKTYCDNICIEVKRLTIRNK